MVDRWTTTDARTRKNNVALQHPNHGGGGGERGGGDVASLVEFRPVI